MSHMLPPYTNAGFCLPSLKYTWDLVCPGRQVNFKKSDSLFRGLGTRKD